MPDVTVHFDGAALHLAVENQRRDRGLSWRAAARQAGVAPSTLTRLGQGHAPSAENLVRLMYWLRLNNVTQFARFTRQEQANA